jgi:hypothetical protein
MADEKLEVPVFKGIKPSRPEAVEKKPGFFSRLLGKGKPKEVKPEEKPDAKPADDELPGPPKPVELGKESAAPPPAPTPVSTKPLSDELSKINQELNNINSQLGKKK